ncbi:MAG TPA: hypothetical protein PKD51_11435 [Saprospiraceae bacterium]|nr:hypothetical protein [Saprospiraceae bacterium]
MYNFFIDNNFYSDLSEYIEAQGWELEDIQDLPDTWVECANESVESKIIKDFSAGWITDKIDPIKWPEDDSFYDSVVKILADNIDFDKIDQLLPSVYIWSKKTFNITKYHLLINV